MSSPAFPLGDATGFEIISGPGAGQGFTLPPYVSASGAPDGSSLLKDAFKKIGTAQTVIGSNVAGASSPVNDGGFSPQTTMNAASGFIARIAVIVVGVVFIGVGLTMFRHNQTLLQTVKVKA